MLIFFYYSLLMGKIESGTKIFKNNARHVKYFHTSTTHIVQNILITWITNVLPTHHNAITE